MGQQIQSWRSGGGDRAWLSTLIETMDEVSRPELRVLPIDRLVLAAVYAQLARPAPARAPGGSAFSLRN
jgi:hypothetical protein